MSNKAELGAAGPAAKPDKTGYQAIPPLVTPAVGEEPPMKVDPPLMRQIVAEIVGTCTLVQIGCAGLCTGIYLSNEYGIWQAAVIWILAAILGIYATVEVSGAHLNPAVSLAFALVRPGDFSFKKLIPFWIAQLIGGILAGIINLIIYHTAITEYENINGIVRGEQGSQKSASAFGDYYSLSSGVASPAEAFFIEAFGTGFLTFIIFTSSSPKNVAVPNAAVPPLAGIAIGTMIAILGSLTGAGINPARDFGPRLVTYFYGWGRVSMEGWWVYIFAPLVGGPIGAMIADFLVHP